VWKKKLISIFVAIALLSNVLFIDAQSMVNEPAANPFASFDQQLRNTLADAKGYPFSVSSLFGFKKTAMPSSLANNEKQKKFIVQFTDTASMQEIFDAVSTYEYKPLGLSQDRQFQIAGVAESAFAQSFQSIISYTSPVVERKMMRSPNDPQLVNQWAIKSLNLKSAWDATVGANSVKIAVLDTGVNRSTADMSTKNILPGYDLNTKGTVLDDTNGHGTGVVSVIAATSNNKSGIAGVCWNISVEPYKIYDLNDTTDTGREIEALKMAALSGCKIISLSFGGPSKNDAEESTIKSLAAEGILIFAAAGNDGKHVYDYPASYQHVISVAACDKNGNRWSESNYNKNVDVSAPGKDVAIMIKNGTKFSIGYGSGTSFATPYAAGVVALACSLAPDLNYEMLFAALPLVCRDRGESGHDNYYGYGIIDAHKIVDYANAHWILKEPIESSAPKKYTVSKDSEPYPGTMEVEPYDTGTYFFKSLGTKDTDLNVLKAVFNKDGSYYYDPNIPFAGDSLQDPDDVLTPFNVKAKLSKGSKYLLDAYANDKCKGDTIDFLMFSPFVLRGRMISVAASNAVSDWSQELVYPAKYAGPKRAVFHPLTTGATGEFTAYKNGSKLSEGTLQNGDYVIDFNADVGNVFSFTLHSDAATKWTLRVAEVNNIYNSMLKEINIEGATLNRAFDPTVFNYQMEATDQRVSMNWIPYYSSVSTKVNQVVTRYVSYFVAGGADKMITIDLNDGFGNTNQYHFSFHAGVKVVGTATPKPTPIPTATPKPTMTPKPVISSMKMVQVANKRVLSITVSWNKKATLKLYVLNSKDVTIKTLWTSNASKAGKKTVLWNLTDSHNKVVKNGLYLVRFKVGSKYVSKRFMKQ